MSQFATAPKDSALVTGLLAVVDVVLPGGDILPSGRSVGDFPELLDRALAADPTLAPVVLRAINLVNDPLTTFSLATLADDEAERLVFALHATYYMSGEVRRALHYPGQGRFPVALATPDQLSDDALVAPVIERGPVYVPTPETARA